MFVSTYLLGGCKQQTVIEPAPDDIPAVVETPPEPVIEYVEDRAFDSDTLYALMVAEFAGDRKRYDLMLNNYVQQAELTEDPGVVAWASRIARFLKARGPSLDMALLWTKVEPENAEAHYNAAAELISANRLIEAYDHAAFLLDKAEVSGFDAIGAQAIKGGDIQTTQALIPKYETLLKKHPTNESLLVGLSFLKQHAGDIDGAIASIRQAGQLSPENAQIAMQEYQLLSGAGRTDEAQKTLANLVLTYPDNVRLRLQLARSLLSTDIEAAEAQFQHLHEQHPSDIDITMTLALVQYERGKLDLALQKLEKSAQTIKHHSTAHFYLGRIYSVKGEKAKAIEHFTAVRLGPDYLPALSQLTDLLSRDGQVAEALNLVTERKRLLPEDSEPKYKEGLYIIESHLYSSNGKLLEAVASLNAGIKQIPDSVRLLYGRAMLYTQLNDLINAEQDFLTVIELEPDNANALNALGYTLAVETDRLEEAAAYVSKAYALEPDNPAVIDSMGWIAFLRGNNEVALSKLTRAMKLMPDHEIAAHLGEVLWSIGQYDQARSTWQTGLELNPNSTIIQETLQRLNVKLP